MVGEGVLHECLLHPDVETVLIVNRRPSGYSHPKLKEIIHSDFFNLAPVAAELQGYNACYFCLGVTSVGLKEPEYTHLTYDLTLNFAELVAKQNEAMTFCYVSGVGTDSSEKGRFMWARVKGHTENALLRLPFAHAYMFRPGYMHATPGLKYTQQYYKYFSWMYPLLRFLIPNTVSTLKDLGVAMINVTLKGYSKSVLEVRDLKEVAKEK